MLHPESVSVHSRDSLAFAPKRQMNPNLSRATTDSNHYHSEGQVMTMLQQITPQRGRRTTIFTPANIQKIKDWVVQGTRREDIAKSLGVTVGSLQVTCSRLGISLRAVQ